MSKDTPEVGDVWEYKYGLTIHNGAETDLKIDDYVFDIELGERIR